MPLHLVKQSLILHFSLSPMAIQEPVIYLPIVCSCELWPRDSILSLYSAVEGASGTCPTRKACIPQPLISHRSGGWKVKVNFNSRFDVWWQCVPMSSQVGRSKGARWGLLIRALTFYKETNHLPKVSPPNSITLDITFQHMNLEGI